MNRNYIYILSLSTLFLVCLSCTNGRDKKNTDNTKEIVKIEIRVKKELVKFRAEDGLTITGDLYTHQGKTEKPFIILFHQAGYSRGEYIETADKFLELGYNCLAIDQRSGGEVNGVVNETHKEAVEKGLPTEYIDAMPDLKAAINYVKDNFETEKLLILGSSYSATLSLIVAAQNPDMVDGVLAFSPGEYFEFEGTTVVDYAAEILVPVFITSAKDEQKKWKLIYEAIPDDAKQNFIPEENGIHGSRALWESTKGYENYWKAVEKFLSAH